MGDKGKRVSVCIWREHSADTLEKTFLLTWHIEQTLLSLASLQKHLTKTTVRELIAPQVQNEWNTKSK